MPITESTHTPSGKPLTAGEFPATGYRTVKANKLKQMNLDIKEVVKSLFGTTSTSFYGMLTRIVSANLFAVLTDMLEMAVEIAPYDTGKLRKSGVVNAYTGSGRTSSVVADVESDGSDSFTVAQHIAEILRPTPVIECEISFSREGTVKDAAGNVIAADVALWAHEELLPYAPRPKRESLRDKWVATKKAPLPKATGPKYLSRAVDQYKHRIQNLMEDAKREAMAEWNRKYGVSTGARPTRTTKPVLTRKTIWAYQRKVAAETGFRPSYKKAKKELGG